MKKEEIKELIEDLKQYRKKGEALEQIIENAKSHLSIIQLTIKDVDQMLSEENWEEAADEIASLAMQTDSASTQMIEELMHKMPLEGE